VTLIETEILVLGAGVSGLLIAAVLSANHDLVMVEKNPTLSTNKFWITDSIGLDIDDLSGLIEAKYSEIDLIAFDDSKFTIIGENWLWRSKELTSHLCRKILANGGKVYYDTRFYTYQRGPEFIHVKCGKLTIRARVVVDCMGYQSPIIRASRLLNISGYYSIVGKTLGLKREIAPIGLHNVMINDQLVFIEVFPVDGYAFVVLIIPCKSLNRATSMIDDFNFLVRNTSYSEYFDDEARENFDLYGTIPVGWLRRTAIERIVFYGEAGQIHPPASCTALTSMLRNRKAVSTQITRALARGSLTADDLDYRRYQINDGIKALHLSVYESFLNGNSHDFKSIISGLCSIDPAMCHKVLYGGSRLSAILPPLVKYAIKTTDLTIYRLIARTLLRSVRLGYLRRI